jgi:hypothetical protein
VLYTPETFIIGSDNNPVVFNSAGFLKIFIELVDKHIVGNDMQVHQSFLSEI